MANPVTLRFGRFELRPAQRSLRADGQPVVLGARAFDMLLALVERRDRVVGVDELLAQVWPGLVVEENNLRQQVAALRKLLGRSAIATVAGRGYRFALPVDDGVGADGAAADGWPPATIDAGAPSSPGRLPLNPRPLIGRELELQTVLGLLSDTRLLTLVGAGGVGKTRLALEAAAQAQGRHRDGARLVELAPLAEPALIPRSVAAALGIHEEPGRPLVDTLLHVLRRREVLIVLDNCEHLIDGCARFAQQVLQASAGARLLATSREPLGIDGETVWRVPSLATASPEHAGSIERLAGFAATRLFVQRAADATGDFHLASSNAKAVAHICHQLDGIPLALELAAARLRSMHVEQVAERLADRFALLTRGSRTALQRHQTLRSLVDWSHELLTEPERVLLRRLSVFAGGCTLEAAEAVCSGEPLRRADVLDLLGGLVDKSLVLLGDGAAGARYRLLETIRQYAAEKLAEVGGEAEAVNSRHLDHLLALAGSVREALFVRDDEPRHMARVEAERANIRVVLAWAQRAGRALPALRLINALHRVWYQEMHWQEMVGWVDRLVAAAGEPATVEQAYAWHMAAMLATNYDPELGRRLAERSLALSRALDYAEGICGASAWIGHIDSRRRDPATADWFERSRAAAERIEDPFRRSLQRITALTVQAGYEALMGHDEAAVAIVRDCEAECARLGGVRLHIGHCRALLGTIATRRGDFEPAERLFAESLANYRAIGSPFDIANSLAQQGFLALRRGDARRALALYRQSLPMHRNYPSSPWATKDLANLVVALAGCGAWAVTARLVGVLSAGATTAEETPPGELSGHAAKLYTDAVVRARTMLGEAAFATEASAGRLMPREQAIELALQADIAAAAPAPA